MIWCPTVSTGAFVARRNGKVFITGNSGFPKSLNVANAVEEKRKPDTRLELLPDEAKFCEWMREQSGLDVETVRRVTGSARFMTGEVEIVNTATKEKPRMGRRAMVPTAEAWTRLREHMALQPPEWVDALVKEPPKPADETPGEAWTPGKGNGTAGGNEWQGWGTALKPALEPITVARKPLIGTVAANVLAHGTGALNIDGCRVNPGEVVPGGGKSARGNGGLYGDGAATENARPHIAGRWPANLIRSGSEPADLLGEAARFFYCAKASRADRNEGTEHLEQRVVSTWGGDEDDLSDGKKSTIPKGNHHPTVKPTDLMAYLVRLVTPPGGLVLDPFMGSGSTGKAAMREGLRFIGCELSAEYLEIARARIESAMKVL